MATNDRPAENEAGDSGGGGGGYVMFQDAQEPEPTRRPNEPPPFKYINGAFSHVLPPVDRHNLIYCGLVLAGVGFLLPYNSFIMAVDYFCARYPDTTIMFDMSTAYIITACCAVFINNALVDALSLDARITFGYCVSLITLALVAICEVWWEAFGVQMSYRFNLAAVSAVALGCTVQQSSFYGYASMLPARYTQALMAGESAAGFWVSANRILTKAVLEDERGNTLVFFTLSALIVAWCFVVHRVLRSAEFVRYHVELCRERRTHITLEPTEDSGLMDPLDGTDDAGKAQYGFLKLQSQSPPPANTRYSAFSFANPVYEPGVPAPVEGDGEERTPKYKVEDVVVRMRSSTTGAERVCNSGETAGGMWGAVVRGCRARWQVAQLVWEDMLAIALAYFLTLCLYPGVMSEISSCRFKGWLPVILMTLFNGFDLLGKICSSRPVRWGRALLPLNGVRAILALLSVVALVNASPGTELEACAMAFAAFLGLTNGVFGSVPMIAAPAKVPAEHREITGNIMTLSYNLGLTAGTMAAYYLNDLINIGGDASKCGPQISTSAFGIGRNVTTLATTTMAWNDTEPSHNFTTVFEQIANTTDSLE